MNAADRAIRVEHLSATLARLGVEAATLVRDAYAAGYRDGLAVARAEQSAPAALDATEPWLDDSDVAERRPTVV